MTLEGEIFGRPLGAKARGKSRKRLEQAMNEGAASEADLVPPSEGRADDVIRRASVKGCGARGRKPGHRGGFRQHLRACPGRQRLKRKLCPARHGLRLRRRHLLEML